MRTIAVLQKLLRRSIPSMHLKRLTALMAVVGGALHGGRLTLSALARGLDSGCAVRHRVKRVDRVLGNGPLQQERLLIYRLLCDLLIGNRLQPVLIVDWSDLRPDRSLQLLRAAVWVHGLALPIYEEIHPIRLQHARRVQREFLVTLRMLLPEGARPIVVTDAGFRSSWFQEIERLGWHWVGRIRNRTMIEWGGQWQHGKKLYPRATAMPQALGVHRITRANPVTGRLSLYHKPPKGRHHVTRYGTTARGSNSRKNARREKEPWLIAAAVSLEAQTALDFINLYRVRMRIEHGFRALKSHQFGFALEDSQSRSAERLAVLLLIHALALFLAWIAGWAAQRTGLHQQLKSNVDRQHRNFSIVTLGWMALTLIGLPLSMRDITAALQAPPPLASSDQRTGI